MTFIAGADLGFLLGGAAGWGGGTMTTEGGFMISKGGTVTSEGGTMTLEGGSMTSKGGHIILEGGTLTSEGGTAFFRASLCILGVYYDQVPPIIITPTRVLLRAEREARSEVLS